MNRLVGSGRKKKTTRMEDNVILDVIKSNRLLTAKKVCEKIKIKNVNVCARTVMNRFHEWGMIYDYPKEKPLLTNAQQETRLDWALKNNDTNWNNVCFNDESSIQIGLSGKKDGY